jgi:mono/diheme cytochrome c family protein
MNGQLRGLRWPWGTLPVLTASVVLLVAPVRALAADVPAAPAAAQSAATPASAGAAPAVIAPEDTRAGALFGSRCTSCHTIGDGRKVGPDLVGVTARRSAEWITRFLTSPTKAIDGGDPIATGLVKEFLGVRMPEQNLKPDEIAGLLQFFAACTAKNGCKPGPAFRLGLDGTAVEIEAGHDLFVGAKPLSKGGPPCIECHHVRGVGLLGGGTLGPDLTLSWARLHDAGWSEALMRTPLEKKVYLGKEPTDAEKFQLKAWFATLSKDGTREPVPGDFLELGLLGAISALGFIGIAWISRKGGERT